MEGEAAASAGTVEVSRRDERAETTVVRAVALSLGKELEMRQGFLMEERIKTGFLVGSVVGR